MESNVSHSSASTSRHYLIPKEIADAIVALGQHKAAHTPLWKTLIGSFYAGFYVAFGGMCAISAAGGLDPKFNAAYPGVGKMIVGVTFWIALILIMTLGGELFTGNLMYIFLARLHGRCTTLQMLTNWFIVFWGNWAAIAICAYILAYQGQLYTAEPWNSYLKNMALHKVEYGWSIVVSRAIGANWMVCCAVCMSIASQDQLSRTVSCFLPVFLFALVGFEHCIANQFYVTLALMYDCPTTLGEFIGNNLIPAAIGNFIGGALICGGGIQLLYLYDSESHDVQATSKEDQQIEQDLKTLVAAASQRNKPSNADNNLNTNQSDPTAIAASGGAVTKAFPSITFSKRFLRRTGEVIRLTVHTTIILDDAGRPTRIFSTMKKTGADSDQAGVSPNIQRVVDSMQPEGCISIMWNGEEDIESSPIALADTTLCHMLGYTREALVGKPLHTITYFEDAHLSTRLFKQLLVLHANNPDNGAVLNRVPNGSASGSNKSRQALADQQDVMV